MSCIGYLPDAPRAGKWGGEHMAAFDWSGGHPALDLVNTLDDRPLDSPVERLPTYRELLRFVELAGLVEPAIVAGLMTLCGRRCSDILERVRELRERLFGVLQAF